MRVASCPSQDLAMTNCAFVSPGDLAAAGGAAGLAEAGPVVFAVRGHPGVEPGTVGLNTIQRRLLRVSVGDELPLVPFAPPARDFEVALLTVEVAFITAKAGREETVDAELLAKAMLNRFAGQVFSVGQRLAVEYMGTNFMVTVGGVLVATAGEAKDAERGLLLPQSTFTFEVAQGSGVKIANQKAAATQLFKHKDFNFETLGIGGLDKQFEQIFRRAFSSRVYPPHIVAKLGINHVKGMLLHGPPGTGKTLIARQIGKMLNGREPKVVNGPEVLNKYVGASEENIRNLFKDAEAEQAAKGEESELHIIIFDEIDAICKQRGSSRDGTGVGDTVVNQLLTKIDGVDALNNILLIGMTNRKDMLDEAMLRPGRMEVQIEIGLPDEKGRQQILKIHTNNMNTALFLGQGVDLNDIAARTKNFSGAELEGLVKSAVSFALNRNINMNDLSAPIDEENLKVEMGDFENAMDEVKPAFGAAADTLESYRAYGVYGISTAFEHIQKTCHMLVEQLKRSEKTPLMTCLLHGLQGSGKTALAATLALDSGFPFVKFVSADNYVGYSESAKCSQIAKVFDDAYKSSMSVIILDEIERLLEYVPIGPRFSNLVLQTLLVLLRRKPPQGKKLLVVGTSALSAVMATMQVDVTFAYSLEMPQLDHEGIRNILQQYGKVPPADVEGAVALLDRGLSLKRLLMLLEMAYQESPGDRIDMDVLVTTLEDLG